MQILLLLAILIAFAFAQDTNSNDVVVIEELAVQPFTVTEKTFTGTSQSLTWCGADNHIVFLLTTTGELYRSIDHGKTWNNEQSKLSALVGGMASIDSTRVGEILLHEQDADRLIFVSYGGSAKTFTTVDGGESYKIIADGMSLHEIKPHPVDRALVLASTVSAGCRDETSTTTCYKTLYVSKDFGVSWQLLDSYIIQFDWTYKLPYSHIRNTPKESILYTKQEKSTDGKSRFGVWDKTVNMWRTDDLFKTSTMLVKSGNRFLFSSKYLMVAQVMENDFHVRLLISTDGSRSFKEAGLPFEMAEHSYTIVDSSDAIFLHVNHWGDKAKFGNVYVSNSHGLNYTLSLPHNVREGSGKCDFEKVLGLEGIYIANYQDNVDFDAAYNREIHNPQKPKAASNNKQLTTSKGSALVRTVITFDQGGEWGYIEAPKFDSLGKATKCELKKGCSLNLQGITGTSGPFYSVENSVGLIMATGNIGKSLSLTPGNQNTFFSRDAGLTWKEVAKGNFIYEFGDHGGLIVMAKLGKKTQNVLYSFDEGHSWKKFKFTETPMAVENIVIEPSSLSQKFMIYGSRDENAGVPIGVLVHVDFAELHTKECQGVDTPDTESSDYEVWTVQSNSAEGSDHCVLGKQISYTRRKQFNPCFNGVEFERPVFVKNCECTEADWECDYNYARNVDEKHGECHEIFKINQTRFMEEQCSVADTYYVVNGYRKVAGDTCSGGIDHSAKVFHCVHWTKQVSGNGWMVIFFFVMIGCSLGGLTFISRQKKGSRAFYSPPSFSFTAPVSYWDSISNFFTDAYEKVSSNMPGQWRHGYYAPGDKIPDSALDFVPTSYDDVNSGSFADDDEPMIYSKKKEKANKKKFDNDDFDEAFDPRS